MLRSFGAESAATPVVTRKDRLFKCVSSRGNYFGLRFEAVESIPLAPPDSQLKSREAGPGRSHL